MGLVWGAENAKSGDLLSDLCPLFSEFSTAGGGVDRRSRRFRGAWPADSRLYLIVQGFGTRALWWEAHAAQQTGEAWVGAKAVERRLYFEPNQSVIPLLKGLFQPGKRLILPAQARVNSCYLVRR